MQAIMSETKRAMEHSVPFAMEPVVYNFAINERGTEAGILTGAGALMPAGYYTLAVPPLLRTEARNLSAGRRAELERFTTACRTVEDFSGMVHNLFDRILRALRKSRRAGRRRWKHCSKPTGSTGCSTKRIQSDLRSGRIGLAQNRLPVTSRIEDAVPDYLDARHRELGMQALAEGRSPWSPWPAAWAAAGPRARVRSRRSTRSASSVGGIATSSKRIWPRACAWARMRHAAAARRHHQLPDARRHCRATGPRGQLPLPRYAAASPGRIIGLRMVPMERDLRFAWRKCRNRC